MSELLIIFLTVPSEYFLIYVSQRKWTSKLLNCFKDGKKLNASWE